MHKTVYNVARDVFFAAYGSKMSGRKFRRKVIAAEDDEKDGEPESLAVPPSSIRAKQALQQKERKEKKLMGKSLLSFGDDEEAHGPTLVKEKVKAKGAGFRAAAAAVLASSKPSAATQTSAPGDSGSRESSACLHLKPSWEISEFRYAYTSAVS